MRERIPFGALGFIVLLVCVAFTIVQAQNEVYLVPQDSNAQAGDKAEVEIWANATDFKSGVINLTYDPGCANVTDYVWNVTNFPLSDWSHGDGSEWITFMASELTLTGNYQIGTLTILCVNSETCGTRLHFDESSTLFDPQGIELIANWVDGTLTCTSIEDSFDTGSGTYPSIMGTHNGTITPAHDIIANKMYTYPCSGTGGHSESVTIYNASGPIAEARWGGYSADYHNVTFDTTFTLLANYTYNYTIRTGSYPQMHHNATLTTSDGVINCSEFVDANGNVYNDWIPAIRLFH